MQCIILYFTLQVDFTVFSCLFPLILRLFVCECVSFGRWNFWRQLFFLLQRAGERERLLHFIDIELDTHTSILLHPSSLLNEWREEGAIVGCEGETRATGEFDVVLLWPFDTRKDDDDNIRHK